MNKLIKFGTISGGLLLLGGVVLTTASFVLGANPVRIAEFLENRFDYDWYIGNAHIRVGDGSGISVQNGEWSDEWSDEWSGEWDDERNGEWKNEMETGGFEAGYPAVTELSISQSGGSVELSVSDEEDGVTVQSSGGKIENLRYTGTEHWQKLHLRVLDGEDYTVSIPSSWILEKVEAEVTGGSLSANGLSAVETEFHAMGGEVIVAQDYANELELDCENGYLSWSVMDSEPVQVHAECVSGLIEVMIPESLKENGIRYDLEWEQGSITLPEEFLEGTGEKISGDGNGASGFYLESGPGGDISVLAEPV